ncbi:hypothetical protein BVX98_04160 [bacterium F11]|nr:hypothetical protein BVX98_04160 [bacterium F11]
MSFLYHSLLSPIVFAIAAYLFYKNEFNGLLFLLGGFLLFNRHFAYIHINLGTIPLYITEFCLLMWISRILIFKRNEMKMKINSMDRLFLLFWGIFFLIGVFSFLRGLFVSSFLKAGRDMALVYYSVSIFLVYLLNLSNVQRKKMFLVLANILLLRIFLRFLFVLFGSESAWLTSFFGQEAASSAYLSIALLVVLAFDEFRFQPKWKIFWCFILLWNIFVELVRSSWVGLIAGLLFLVVAYFIIYKKKISTDSLKWMFLLFLLACLILVFLPQNKKGQSLYGRVAREIGTFSRILKSSNVQTRLLMWEDAVSEVVSTGLYSSGLAFHELNKYELPKSKLPKDIDQDTLIRIETVSLEKPEESKDGKSRGGGQIVMQIRPLAKGLRNKIVRIVVRDKDKSLIADSIGSCFRMLFGIPMGKPFLPPQVVYRLNSPYRYDPHNSVIAIFYRMGFIGLFAFIGMIVFVYIQIFRLKIKRKYISHDFHLLVAAGAGMTYVLVHSLTDVVLENSFKGLWLWIMIGLVMQMVRKIRIKQKLI